MRSMPIPLFRIVDQMATAFCGVTGFSASSFMSSVSPQSTLGERVEDKCVTRSFHYYPYGSFACVQVHGAPRSSWVRHIAKSLTKAGYERTWKLKDETGFRRWVFGERARNRELGFLSALGDTGSPQRWPERATTLQPIRPRKPTLREWDLVVTAVRLAEMVWDTCAVGYSRREDAHAGSKGATLDVSSVAFDCRPSDLSVAVCAHVASPAKELPSTVQRSVCQELRRAGYRTRKREGQIWGTKTTKSAVQAARESERLFRCLTERLREVK